jgi:hypothetical protein
MLAMGEYRDDNNSILIVGALSLVMPVPVTFLVGERRAHSVTTYIEITL